MFLFLGVVEKWLFISQRLACDITGVAFHNSCTSLQNLYHCVFYYVLYCMLH